MESQPGSGSVHARAAAAGERAARLTGVANRQLRDVAEDVPYTDQPPSAA